MRREPRLRQSLPSVCVIATAVLVLACGRESSVNGNRRTQSPAPVHVEDVRVLGTEVDFTVLYRTRTSIRDGEAQVAEISKVWDEVVRPRLNIDDAGDHVPRGPVSHLRLISSSSPESDTRRPCVFLPELSRAMSRSPAVAMVAAR